MKKKKNENPSIPLKVKDDKLKKISLAIRIIIVVILLVVNAVLLMDLLSKKHIEDQTDEIKIVNEKPENKDLKNNSWFYNNKKYVFNEDNTFVYYDNDHDYYTGTYQSLNGKKAIEEMGYTEEDIKSQFGDNINENNIYSIQLTPTKRVVNKIDKSKVIKPNTKWWLVLVIKSDNTALGYNKTLDERYELIKVE